MQEICHLSQHSRLPYGILSVLENFQRATKFVERYPHALGKNDNILSTSRSYTEYLSTLKKVFQKN